MPGTTAFSSFTNALTTQAQLDIWTLGFTGGGASPPDTAAAIIQPTDLLGGPVLNSLLLSDLTLDPSTYTPVSVQVALARDTGLVVASWTATIPLPQADYSTLVGMALFSEKSGHLWYVSAFSSLPAVLNSPYVWAAKVTLNTPCQGS